MGARCARASVAAAHSARSAHSRGRKRAGAPRVGPAPQIVSVCRPRRRVRARRDIFGTTTRSRVVLSFGDRPSQDEAPERAAEISARWRSTPVRAEMIGRTTCYVVDRRRRRRGDGDPIALPVALAAVMEAPARCRRRSTAYRCARDTRSERLRLARLDAHRSAHGRLAGRLSRVISPERRVGAGGRRAHPPIMPTRLAAACSPARTTRAAASQHRPPDATLAPGALSGRASRRGSRAPRAARGGGRELARAGRAPRARSRRRARAGPSSPSSLANVRRPRRASAPACLPSASSLPVSSRMSSTIWKSRPSSAPNARGRLDAAASAPRHDRAAGAPRRRAARPS